MNSEHLVADEIILNADSLQNDSLKKPPQIIAGDEDTILSFGEYADKVELDRKSSPSTDDKISKDPKNMPDPPPNDIKDQSTHNTNNTTPTAAAAKTTTTDQPKKETKTTKLRSNYNYASSSCGATIISHSHQVKHSSEMLIDNPDTYALFPCINTQSKPLWFIIQLCEPINIRSIYLSNMELFSSHIKTFRVSLTNIELSPTDSQWHQLENDFTMADGTRSQMFSTENSTVASNIYARYIRVEIIEHHNMDFFCPISVFKVFGVSLVDELSGGPSLDDDSPFYSNSEDPMFTMDEPFAINNLYDFYRWYKVDILIQYLIEILRSLFIIVGEVGKELISLVNLLTSKSPTLRFFHQLIIYLLQWLAPLISCILKLMADIGSKLIGVDIHYFNNSLIVQQTHLDVDPKLHPENESSSVTELSNSECTLLTCTLKLLRQPFYRDFCCTMKHVWHENFDLKPDCSLCKVSRNKYGLATTDQNLVHSCLLDDFCDFYCRNNSTWSSNTGIVPFSQYYATNESNVNFETSSLNETVSNLTDSGNDKNHPFVTTEQLSNTTSSVPLQPSFANTANATTVNETLIYNSTVSADNENISNSDNGKVTTDPSEDGKDKNGIENHFESTTPKPTSSEASDSFTTASIGSTTSSPVESSSTQTPNSAGASETGIPKLKDMINVRDDSHLGYISRIRKNLTITMKYLDDMSVKFKKALDDVKKQVSRAVDESNSKAASIARQYNQIISLSSLQNSTFVILRDEINKIRYEFTHRRGIYINLSLYDCVLIVVYVVFITFVYKLCRHICLLVFLTLLKWHRIRVIVEHLWNFYWSYVYPSSESSLLWSEVASNQSRVLNNSDLQLNGHYIRDNGLFGSSPSTTVQNCNNNASELFVPSGASSHNKYFSFNDVQHEYYPLSDQQSPNRFYSERRIRLASPHSTVAVGGVFCPKCSSTKLSTTLLETADNDIGVNYKSELISLSPSSKSSAGSVRSNTPNFDKESDHLDTIYVVKRESLSAKEPHESTYTSK